MLARTAQNNKTLHTVSLIAQDRSSFIYPNQFTVLGIESPKLNLFAENEKIRSCPMPRGLIHNRHIFHTYQVQSAGTK